MQGYNTDVPYLDKDDQDLYQGTAKAAEGLAAERVFALAKQDTMHIVVHWQDADSTSEKAFRGIILKNLKSLKLMSPQTSLRRNL